MDAVGLALNIKEIFKLLHSFYEKLADAPDGLRIVIAKTERFSRQLDQLSSIEHSVPKDDWRYLEDQVNTVECKSTIENLQKLAKKIRHSSATDEDCDKSKNRRAQQSMKLKERLHWVWNEDDFKKLSDELDQERQRLEGSIIMIIGKCVLLTKEDTLKLVEASLKETTSIVYPADAGVYAPLKKETTTWLGQFRCKPGQSEKMPYFKDRADLANAKWNNDWTKVMMILSHAREVYHQDWVNCWRVWSFDSNYTIPSGYTLLHHTAYHGAPKEIVEKLIQMGAWRLSRTIRGHEHNTPLDVARHYKWRHLLAILSPRIQRPLPYKALYDLQKRLQELIHNSFDHDSDVHLECFVLPEVEILMEFENPRMWFPLQPELDTLEGEGIGVLIFLDRLELVVVVTRKGGERNVWRISRWETREIENAIILG